jgi:hypothetical protein
LERPHGHLDRHHVLLSEDGRVKLNIADAMFAHNAKVLTDTQALGYLIRQVMDRESGIQLSHTLQLQRLENRSLDAQEFLYSTQEKSCSELLMVSEIERI